MAMSADRAKRIHDQSFSPFHLILSFLTNHIGRSLAARRIAASNGADTRSLRTAAMAVVLSIDAMVSHSW
jgi:hypothetical protein